MSSSLPPSRTPAWLTEFQAFTGIVQSLVKDILTPVIGLLVGGIDFTNLFITLRGPVAHTLADAQKAGAVTINYGVFLNAVFQFLIVSFAVFWLVRMLSKLYQRKPATVVVAPTASEVLLGEIRDLLRSGRAS